ncbi:MAG TPA: 7-carboxy-7-deazaguanine synthase QueE [Flavobacteriales bacterium]|nr:7-carboxy-7-deazaguanine synthase QueE [Flavobacteriales bacterium]
MKTVFEPIPFNAATEIPVMEEFYTLQGEGKHTGTAAYFIRLAGCDVGCTWCDVKESWPVQKNQLVELNTLVKNAQKNAGRFVVVTGGEPTLYDLNALTKAFHDAGFLLAIETSGTNKLTGNFDWVCLSPKKFKPATDENFKLANELKIIAYNRHDFEWALEQAAKTSPSCTLYIQPEWDKAAEMTPLVVDFVKNNPKWKISLQTHKYLNIP